MNAVLDETAERAVLGAILVRNAAFDEIADVLEPEHFGREHHRPIFAAIRSLHAAGRAIDFVTLRAELERMGALDESGRVYVSQLADGVPSSTNVKYYAGIVREKALLRGLRDAARRIIADAEGGQLTGAALLEQAEAAIYGLGSQAVRSQWLSSLDLTHELYPLVEKFFTERSAVTGLPTGFHDLDFMLRGLQRGDLVLLGARPSQGKTAFGIQVAMRAAATVPTAFFSVEMSREGIGLRQLIQAADVDGFRLMSGRLSELDQRRVGEGLARMGALHLWLDESPHLSPLHVRSRLRRLKGQVGQLGLVVIDYVQLMAPIPEDKRENKTNQVAGISRMLKIIAREMGVPFLVLSQLHRVPDNRRPGPQDFRDSGALEQDADVALLLHRPEVYEPTPENAGLAELIVVKQRNGPTGIVELTWRPEQMQFANRSRQ